MTEAEPGLGGVATRLPEILLLVTGDGNIVDANPAAAKQFGLSTAQLRNLKVDRLLDNSDGGVSRYLANCAVSGSPLTGAVKAVNPDAPGNTRFRSSGFALTPAQPDKAATIVLRLVPAGEATSQFRLLTERIDALNREVERRLHAERVLDSQRQVLQMIAEDQALSQVLHALTRFIDERSTEGCKSSILLLDAGTGTLRHGAAPSLPDEYCAAIDGLEIGPSVGSCGTAAYLNRPVLVSDIENDPLWEGFAELAIEAGLRSCFSTPVVGASQQVLGTFALYYDSVREFDPGDKQLVEFMARSAALAIERDYAGAEISALLEREREARRDAEEANRSKDEFLAMVSHELRNPLNAILGWARLLKMDASDPKNLADGIDAIERNASLQARLINEILDYSRVRAGKLGMEPEPTELGNLVRATVESAAPDAAIRQIELRYESELRAPLVLSIDSNRIQQVINNIIDNALKFTPAGGTVEVRLSSSDKHVQIDVTDTGCGIAPEFLPQVFERFRQEDGSRQRKHQGLGLGLAIVREVVELHRGDVTAHSDGIDRGARFTVRLPRVTSHASVTEEKAGAIPQLQGFSVLAVDDAADVRVLLKTVFESAGATVHVAASGREALDVLDREAVDILLCDIGMPGMDGYEVVARLRAREADAGPGRLPAIALTAYARDKDRKQAISAGFDSHMAKPIDPAMLLQTVAQTAMREAAGIDAATIAGKGRHPAG